MAAAPPHRPHSALVSTGSIPPLSTNAYVAVSLPPLDALPVTLMPLGSSSLTSMVTSNGKLGLVTVTAFESESK